MDSSVLSIPTTTYIGSAPHGVTSYDSEAKCRLAKLAGSTPEKLQTITITNSGCDNNKPFYESILKYAGLYDILSGQKESSALAVEAKQRHYSKVRHHSRYFFERYGNITPGKGEVKKEVTSERKKIAYFLPGVHFGLGDTVVTWPPPNEIKASKIISMHEQHDPEYLVGTHLEFAYDVAFHSSKNKSKVTGVGSKLAENGNHIDGNHKVDESPFASISFNEGHKTSFSCLDENESNISKTEGFTNYNGCDHHMESIMQGEKYTEKKPRKNIYISHYSVGDLVSDFDNIERMFEITICSTGDLSRLYDFCRGVLQWDRAVDTGKVEESTFELYRFRIQQKNKEGKWGFDGIKSGRSPSSVILRSGCMDLILDDARNFYSSSARSWYKKHGVPHRRAYLLHGPPGTGKTSTIRVLASDLQLTACFLHFASSDFTNQMLADALRDIPENALLVIEDVDSLFNENREGKASNDQALTFSGLLNALDGLISVDSILTILTSNHPDKLDKALIRGGRVDRSFLFDYPSKAEVGRYFRSFYGEEIEQHIVETFIEKIWSCSVPTRARNISTLQQAFIEFRGKSAEECANEIEEFLNRLFELDRGEKPTDKV